MSLLNSNIPCLSAAHREGLVLNVTIELVQTANLRHYKQLPKNQRPSAKPLPRRC